MKKLVSIALALILTFSLMAGLGDGRTRRQCIRSG